MCGKIFTISLFIITVAACGLSSKKQTAPEETKIMLKNPESTTQPTSSTSLKSESSQEASLQAQEVKKAISSAAQHIQSSHREAQIETARKPGPVPAEKAWGWLRNGNIRFTKDKFRRDGVSPKDRIRLASQQVPHSVVLSCSDSHVPPEIVFDQKLGEIFVIRTYGQSMDNNVIGSLEQAVHDLGANLIVVMGHESCEAISTALSSLKGMSAGSPALEGLINDLKPRLKQYATMAPSADMLNESWSNVEGISKDLLERSAILRDAIASGEVKIVKAMYHLESGQVEWR